MLRIRYFYFLLYLHFIVCMIEFTPKLIYAGRYNSSLSSLVTALFLTSVMVILFERQMKRFPGESIHQIMTAAIAPFIQKCLFLISLLFSYWSGLIFLMTFTQIMHKFISPDLAAGLLFFVFLLLVILAALLDSKSILFMLEIVVLFQIPFTMVMILIFLSDSNVRVDFLLEGASYIRNWPSYQMIAAGAYLFNGYMSRLVFNEHLESSKPKKQYPLVWSIGLLLMLSCYFIPIGYLGLAGIDGDKDAWVTTTNSMRLPHFFIERFLVVFLMVQLSVTLIFVIISWHSSLQFLRQANLMSGGKHKWILVPLFLIVSCFLWPFMDESKAQNSLSWFLNSKLAFDVLMLGVIVWCAQKRKAA